MKLPSIYPWIIDSKTALALPEISMGVDGTLLQDFSLSGHKGTFNSTVTVPNDAVFGRVLSFNTGPYVSFPHSSAFNITTKLFCMAWVNPTSYGGNNAGGIFNKKSAAADGFQLRLLNTSNSLNLLINNTAHAVAAGIVLGKWQLVGAYFDKDLASNQITYFRNDSIVGTATETNAITTNSSILTVGNANGTALNAGFNGQICRAFIGTMETVDGALSRIRNEYARFS